MWYINPDKPADICASQPQRNQNIMWTASTIGPGISINYSNVKQSLGLWLPDPPGTQVSDQSVSANRSIMHNWLLNNRCRNQRSKFTKSIPNLLVPTSDQAPKATIKGCSILNGAPQPSHTEGKDNSGFF